MTYNIDLNEARIPPTSEILSGRDCGEESRRRFRLDEIDAAADAKAIVTIPDDVISMNTSFFLGLFGPSVRRLRSEFLNKYQFECDDVHMATVREGIVRALKEQTIFGQKKTA
jgi:hypothetical protein